MPAATDQDAGAREDATAVDEAGPVPACSTAADCPLPPNDCVVAACNGSSCATTNVAAGIPCSTGGGTVCDGKGACGACVAATDCAPSLTACTTNTCTANTCGAANASADTTCTDNGGRLCDGSGTCVACNAVTDCPVQTTVCKTSTCTGNACGVAFATKGTICSDSGGSFCDGDGTCAPPHCTDNVMNDTETDVDCGGSCGPTCKDTAPQQKCLAGADCISGVCSTTTLLCQPPTCTDGVQNGNETDVDCGGAGFGGKHACPTCADKKHCAKNSDCAHNSCSGSGPGTCVSCTDGVKDGSETDTDCGGASCDGQAGKKCATGRVCLAGADCQTGDCSGGTCQLLPDGTGCRTNAQCLHGACLGVTGGGKICCNTPCPDTGAPSCGTNGSCMAGGAACAYYPSGTTCPGTCAGNTLTKKACDGAGACQIASTSACAAHLDCSGTACLKGCGNDNANGDANCADGYWCDGNGNGACQAPQPKDKPCTRNAQCVNSCNTGPNKCK